MLYEYLTATEISLFTFKDSFAKAFASFKAHESRVCNERKHKRNRRKSVVDFHIIPADEIAMHFSFCITIWALREWKKV